MSCAASQISRCAYFSDLVRYLCSAILRSWHEWEADWATAMYVYLEGATRKVLRAMLRIRMRRGHRGCGRAGGEERGEEVLTALRSVASGVPTNRFRLLDFLECCLRDKQPFGYLSTPHPQNLDEKTSRRQLRHTRRVWDVRVGVRRVPGR